VLAETGQMVGGRRLEGARVTTRTIRMRPLSPGPNVDELGHDEAASTGSASCSSRPVRGRGARDAWLGDRV
jgi:hypothetical protein